MMSRDQAPIEELCQNVFVEETTWESIVEAGFATLCVSENAGGFGGDVLELWTVAREAGRAVLRQPVIANAILPAHLLERAGETELHEAMMAGEVSVALADARDLHFEGGKLTGTVAVSGDQAPDRILVVSPQGELLLASAGADKWQSSARIDGWPAGKISFEQTEAVPIGGGNTRDLAKVAGRLNRLAAAAEIAGLTDRAVSLTVTFLGERSQFGQKLSAFQALRHRMVDAMIAAQEIHALSLRVALALEADPVGADEGWLDALAVKGAQVAELVGTEAVQMHGGVGTTDEYLVSHLFRRLTALILTCEAPGALMRLAAAERGLPD